MVISAARIASMPELKGYCLSAERARACMARIVFRCRVRMSSRVSASFRSLASRAWRSIFSSRSDHSSRAATFVTARFETP